MSAFLHIKLTMNAEHIYDYIYEYIYWSFYLFLLQM